MTDARAPRDMPAELHPRHLVRRVIELAVLAALVAGAVTALPGLGDLRHRFAHADPAWIAVCGIAELASCLAYVVVFRAVFGRRLRWIFSYELGMAEQATNVLLPTGGAGGLALGAWALREGGMPTDHIARRSVAFFIVTSAPNFVSTALFGALVAGGVLGADEAPLGVTAGLAAGAAGTIGVVAALPAILDRRRGDPGAPEPSGRVRRLLRRGAGTLSDGVRDAGALLRSGDPLIVLGSISYMAFDVAALAASFTAFGGAPSFGPFVFAYVVGQLGGLIPLPGGVGGTDGGLIGALVLYGTPLSQAAAAVLAYRAFQLGLPAILGAVAFAGLRRRLAHDPDPAAVCRPLAKEPARAGS